MTERRFAPFRPPHDLECPVCRDEVYSAKADLFTVVFLVALIVVIPVVLWLIS